MHNAVASNLKALTLASGRGATAQEIADTLAIDDVGKVRKALHALKLVKQVAESDDGRWRWVGKVTMR